MPLDPQLADLMAGAQAAPQQQAPASVIDPQLAALAQSAGGGDSSAPPPSLAASAASAFVRPVLKAATAAPGTFADAATALGNILTGGVPLRAPDGSINWSGKNYNGGMQLPTQVFGNALDSFTVKPQTAAGQVPEFLSTMMLSSRLPQGLPGMSAPQTAANVTNLNGAQQAALAAGRKLGFQTTPGQAFGSVPLQQVEAKLESQPWTSGPISAVRAGNQTTLNRVASRSIGEDSPTLDATVLGRADERLGGVFQNIRNSSRIVSVDPKAEGATLDALDNDYSGLITLDNLRAHPLVRQFSDLMNGGGANLQQLGQLSSKLGRAAFKEHTSPSGDRDLGEALSDVKNHIDDLVQSALTPQEAAEYANARGQYRNLMTLVKPNVTNSSSGNVSGANLANALARQDRSGFTYGRNQSDLYNAARFARAFKPIVGDSGTATRSSPWLLPMIGSMLGGGAGAAHGVEGAAAGGNIGMALAPLLANVGSRAYMSAPGAAAARSIAGLPQSLPRNVSPLVLGGLLAAPQQ